MISGRRADVAIAISVVALVLSGCGGAAGAESARGGAYPQTAAMSRAPEAPQADSAAPAPAEPAMERSETIGFASDESGPAPAKGAPPPPPPASAPGEKKPEQSKPADGADAPHETTMLIYTAHVTMAVYQVDQGLAAIEKIARDNGGYLASRGDREIVIRIPRGRFEPVLGQIDKVGDVIHRDVQAQDVTDDFVDTEIRIKNARAMQARLKVLLDKANVKEAIEIEKEMRRVTEELELLEGKLKLLKDKIAYSTITVSFQPRGSTIQTTKIKLPFPWLTRLGLPTLLQLSEDR